MIRFDDHLDLLIVGGGIVGAGIARDAVMRGLRTALVEQHDFASGTSSRSTRLLHGGIRYLAQGRIGLVREASREKTILHHIAPHLSDPLDFIFPTYRNQGIPLWKLRLGVKLYDLLCGRRNLGPSRHLVPSETVSLLPELATDGLTGAVCYYDGLTNDARLVLDTLRSADHRGASIQNYVQFLNATPDLGQWLCQLRDVRSGKEFSVRTRCLANATGPWSDRIDHSRTSLRLTKGVHLVIDHARLAVPQAVVLAEGERILFAIPWGERVILGTTDTDYDGLLDAVHCDDRDTAYVLESANRVFPGVRLTASDVLSTWAGLRPLVADRRGNPSDISRRHEIKMSHPGWWDVTGGKLTTYRLMAEETVSAMVGYLDVDAPPCRTAQEPLLASDETKGVSAVLPPEVTQASVVHYCRAEWARHLDDVMIRRTSWRYYHRDHLGIAQRVAEWMAAVLKWNKVNLDEELVRYQRLTTL
jgi:glycerol-3-phosphate dehydrogenase